MKTIATRLNKNSPSFRKLAIASYPESRFFLGTAIENNLDSGFAFSMRPGMTAKGRAAKWSGNFALGYIRRLMPRLMFILAFACALTTGSARAQQMVIEPEVCQQLVQHTPRPDVAYQPGVDVNGDAVAPADLPSSSPQIKLPQQIKIPLTSNIANQFGVKLPGGLSTDTDAVLGVVAVDTSSGAVTFNGQPLSDQQQQNLAVMCLGH